MITQITVTFVSFIFLLCIMRLVHKKKLLLKYSLLWLALGLLIIFTSLFPGLIYQLAPVFGFQLASNFLYLLAIFFLLAITLSLSIVASKQATYINAIVQEIALLEKEINSDTEKHKLS